MNAPSAPQTPAPLTRYQGFVAALLAFLQFTIVLDFMILSPLGPMLLSDFHITTAQFGLVVSAYAFSAGAAGLLAAGFADRFDRKRMLVVMYAGFVVGTALCGLAPSYELLLAARIVTGCFGGVVGSITFAIVADLFSFSQRGRVMGIVQTSFAAAQVLGLPAGLWLASHGGWHVPFLVIAAVAAGVGVLIAAKLQPVTGHLEAARGRNAFAHLWATASKPRHLAGFSATILLATGGFMLMPFGSTFSVNNLGIAFDSLPLLYVVTGLASIVTSLYAGGLSDRFGKFPVFVVGTLVTLPMALWYTHLSAIAFWPFVAINAVMFTGISTRMVAASALASGVPAPADRGAYMSINSSLQQVSGGAAAAVAGMIVHQSASGRIEGYGTLGFVVAGTMVATLFLMGNIDRIVRRGT